MKRFETVDICVGIAMTSFSELVDETRKKTYISKDDRLFEAEQKRKRAKKPIPPVVMPNGPCCGRCHHWVEPDREEVYGRCRVGFVQFAGNKYSMQFVSLKEVEDKGLSGVTENRTTAAFAGCSLYAPATYVALPEELSQNGIEDAA